MFIRPISDIHNEFSIFDLPVTEVDGKAVLVLAGDIAIANRASSTLTPFLDSVTDRFAHILYIPGNHEYYSDGSLLRVDAKLENACKRYPNVHYMNRKTKVIDGVKFIGATLWTDFNNGDPRVTMEAHSTMNDYNHIRTGTFAEPYARKIRPIDIMGINADHRMFIEHELILAHSMEEKVVVFTHHGPTLASRPNIIPSGPLDYAYYNASKIEDLIFDYKPLVWIHGHSHFPVDMMLGDTRLINNPRGYSDFPASDEGLGFFGDLVIEL